jgi:hypothetical protein
MQVINKITLLLSCVFFGTAATEVGAGRCSYQYMGLGSVSKLGSKAIGGGYCVTLAGTALLASMKCFMQVVEYNVWIRVPRFGYQTTDFVHLFTSWI